MDITESKYGSIFVMVFSVLSVLLAATGFFCGASSCAALLIVPVLPWILLIHSMGNIDLPLALYPVLFLLNVAIIFLLGAFVEYLVERR